MEMVSYAIGVFFRKGQKLKSKISYEEALEIATDMLEKQSIQMMGTGCANGDDAMIARARKLFEVVKVLMAGKDTE